MTSRPPIVPRGVSEVPAPPAGTQADPLDLLDRLSPGTRRRLVRELARHLRDAREERETLRRRRSLP